MLCFNKVKVKKTRIFLADLYRRREDGEEILQKQDCLLVATKQGYVDFEEIKDFTKDELRLYETNGFIAHFVKAGRGAGDQRVFTKNIRPVYSLYEQGYASYKQTMKYLQDKSMIEREL